MMEKATPEKLFELACRNPMVKAFLTYWQRGDLTWEQTLLGCVLALGEANEKLLQMAIAEQWRQPVILQHPSCK